MYLPYYSNHSDTLGVLVVIIAPSVFLLCWLYNAHRLGKFKKPRHAPPDGPNIASRNTLKTALLISAGLLAGLLLGLAYRFLL